MKQLLILVSVLLISCASKSSKEVLVRNYGYTQGTTYHISYMSSNARTYQSDIDSVLHAVDRSMSTYIDSSMISKINRNESYEVDTLFIRVFETAQMIAQKTQGAFDPTIAPMVNYWGFGFDELSKKNKEDFVLVDTREDNEWANGHIPGAIHIGKGVIERDIETLVPDKDKTIILYCGGGFRSALAAQNLEIMGYKNPISMDGGFKAYKDTSLDFEH